MAEGFGASTEEFRGQLDLGKERTLRHGLSMERSSPGADWGESAEQGGYESGRSEAAMGAVRSQRASVTRAEIKMRIALGVKIRRTVRRELTTPVPNAQNLAPTAGRLLFR